MSLELSKAVAAVFLGHAKNERDTNRAMMNREIASARNYYNNYMRAVTRAAKHRQMANEWDRVIGDLKTYEPDREILPTVEEFVTLIRKDISKGKDLDLENLIPDE